MGCFQRFPLRVQKWFNDDCHKVTIHHSDLNDTRYPAVLKQLLHKHCLDKKMEAKEKRQMAEIEDLKTEVKDVKNLMQKMLENTDED